VAVQWRKWPKRGFSTGVLLESNAGSIAVPSAASRKTSSVAVFGFGEARICETAGSKGADRINARCEKPPAEKIPRNGPVVYPGSRRV
jgi:hypothetical protein